MPLGKCNFVDGTGPSNDSTLEQTTGQKDEAPKHRKKIDATEAEKTVAANKGRAIAFGKTVAVATRDLM